MAGTYTLPQLKVHQDFTLAPRDITQNLNPCVMGLRYEILSYADDATKGDCSHDAYATGASVLLTWSGSIAAGSVVDKNFAEVTLDDVYARYSTGVSHVGTAIDADGGKASTFRFDEMPSDKSLDGRGGKAAWFGVAVVPGDWVLYTPDGGTATYVKIRTVTSDTISLVGKIDITGDDEMFGFVRHFDSVAVKAADVTRADGGVTVSASVKAPVSGVDCDVLKSTAYLTQRNRITDGANRLGTVATDTDIVAFCGPIVPENPIAYGLHLTLRNCASAAVRYMIVESDDTTGWTKALEMATNTNEIYAICPLTKDEACLDLVEQHCEAMSQPEEKSWRIAFMSNIPARDASASATEWAEAIAERSARILNKRIYNVAPSRARDFEGREVDGMFVAAAVCGLACSVLPQQPITNVEIEGFADIPDTYSTFSRSDLNIMAGGGTLIVMQDRPDSAVYVRHQISTDYPNHNTNTMELSIVRNVDSISYYFANRFAPYIGRYNVTEELLAELKAVLKDGLSYLKTATEGNRLIGPQILAEGSEIRNIYQDPASKDHVIANVSLNLPAPFNNFDLYLQVI